MTVFHASNNPWCRMTVPSKIPINGALREVIAGDAQTIYWLFSRRDSDFRLRYNREQTSHGKSRHFSRSYPIQERRSGWRNSNFGHYILRDRA